MNADGHSAELLTLTPSRFVLVGATLALLALVPAAFWLGDAGLLPWAAELRWKQLRREVHEPVAAHQVDDFVGLRRGACFGSCPEYEVRVFASGLVQFTGFSGVCARGSHSARVDPALALDLLHDFEAAGLASLAWTPGILIADAPSAWLTLARGGSRIRIERLHDDTHAPRLLRHLEAAIDEVAGTARWLPRRVGHERICELPDGSRRPAREVDHPEG